MRDTGPTAKVAVQIRKLEAHELPEGLELPEGNSVYLGAVPDDGKNTELLLQDDSGDYILVVREGREEQDAALLLLHLLRREEEIKAWEEGD